MKKFFLIVSVFFASISLAQAQDGAKKYGFWDNWFIQGQIGGQYTFSEYNKDASFGDKISPTAALGIGKFVSPEAGARLQLGGWTSGNYFMTDYDVKYFNINLDALFNLTNIFCSYKEGRTFNFYGIVGMGFVHTFADKDVRVPLGPGSGLYAMSKTDGWAPRLGLQTDFRINDAWSFNLEANANFMIDKFNGQVYGKSHDVTTNLLAGFTYRFKERGFPPAEIHDPAYIQNLNDQINNLRGQVEEYKACCEKKQQPVITEPKTIIKEVPAKPTVYEMVLFRINKAVIDKNQEAAIYTVAQFMKENPDAKITITSTADKKTGTPQYNQKLSEKRSAAVVKVLTNKYGIDKSRITVVNNGDKEQPFPSENSWNRVSIFTSK